LMHRGARLEDAEDVFITSTASDLYLTDAEHLMASRYLSACRQQQKRRDFLRLAVPTGLVIMFLLAAGAWFIREKEAGEATAVLAEMNFSKVKQLGLHYTLQNFLNFSTSTSNIHHGAKRSLAGTFNFVTPALIGFAANHPNGIKAIALSKDDLVLSASNDGTVTITTIKDGRVLKKLNERRVTNEGLVGVHFLNNKLAAISTELGEVLLVKIPELDITKRIGFECRNESLRRNKENNPNFSTVSPDGQWFAASFTDGTLAIMNLANGMIKSCESGYYDSPKFLGAIAFSPDSKRLAISSRRDSKENGPIKLIELASMRILWESSKTPEDPGCAIWTYDVKFYQKDDEEFIVAGCSDRGAVTFSAATGKYINAVLPGPIANSVAVSPDGYWLAVGQNSHSVVLLRNAPENVGVVAASKVLHGHAGQVLAASFSSNGQYLVSGDDTGLVMVWDLRRVGNTPGISDAFDADHKPGGMAMALSHDGKRLFAQIIQPTSALKNSCSTKLGIWNTTNHTMLKEVQADNMIVENIRLVDGGRKALVGGNTKRMNEGSAFHGACSPQPVACLLDVDQLMLGKWACTPMLEGGRVWATAFNEATGEAVAFRGWPSPETNRTTAFHPVILTPGSTVASPVNIATKTGNPTEFIEGILTADFSPDGRWLAYGGYDGEVTLVDWRKRRVAGRIWATNMVIRAIRFSPDGRWLAAGTEGDELKIWPTDKLLEPDSAITLRSNFGISSLLFTGKSHPGYLIIGKMMLGIDILDLEVKPPSIRSVSINTEGNDNLGVVWSMAVKSCDGTLYAISSSPFFNVLGEPGGMLLSQHLPLTLELAAQRAKSLLNRSADKIGNCDEVNKVAVNQSFR